MLQSVRPSIDQFRPAAIALALWMGAAAAALATDDLRLPENAVEIDVRNDVTIEFSETNVIEAGDRIDSIVGVSSQFGDGRMIIGEAFFGTPMALAELKAMADATGSTAMVLRCARGGLIQVEGHDVISAAGCVMAPDDEPDERKN